MNYLIKIAHVLAVFGHAFIGMPVDSFNNYINIKLIEFADELLMGFGKNRKPMLIG